MDWYKHLNRPKYHMCDKHTPNTKHNTEKNVTQSVRTFQIKCKNPKPAYIFILHARYTHLVILVFIYYHYHYSYGSVKAQEVERER